MYPTGCLIDSEGNNIVVFEKDLNNPNNEGFIEFWELNNISIKQLKFKKRTTKNKAFAVWKSLIKDGWKITEVEEVA